MAQGIQDIDQLRFVMDGLAFLIERTHGERLTSKLLDMSLKQLAVKQKRYKDDKYLDQIEKDVVYFKEAALACIRALATYLRRGEPRVQSNEELTEVIDSQRIIAQGAALLQVNFIRNGCDGCDVHQRHEVWAAYRDLRANLEPAAYLQELEFARTYEQILLTASQYLLGAALPNHALAETASQLAPEDVLAGVEERLRFRADLWSGLMVMKLARPLWFSKSGQVLFEAGRQLGLPPSWRDVWGEQFDTFAASLANARPESPSDLEAEMEAGASTTVRIKAGAPIGADPRVGPDTAAPAEANLHAGPDAPTPPQTRPAGEQPAPTLPSVVELRGKSFELYPAPDQPAGQASPLLGVTMSTLIMRCPMEFRSTLFKTESCARWIRIIAEFTPSAWVCPHCKGLILLDLQSEAEQYAQNDLTASLTSSISMFFHFSTKINWNDKKFMAWIKQRTKGLKVLVADACEDETLIGKLGGADWGVLPSFISAEELRVRFTE